ncbi:MAG: DUF167 domain-containing protein [Campylobacterales bacterium]|nr:DUF167 domain-containing protein [Campylobacterales bacterium]
MFYKIEEKTVWMHIKAQPKASKSEFCGLYDEQSIKVRIQAAAVEGEANKELCRFLSKSFKVPKSSIVFKSGETSKIKTVTFPLSEKFEAWIKEGKYGKSV